MSRRKKRKRQNSESREEEEEEEEIVSKETKTKKAKKEEGEDEYFIRNDVLFLEITTIVGNILKDENFVKELNENNPVFTISPKSVKVFYNNAFNVAQIIVASRENSDDLLKLIFNHPRNLDRSESDSYTVHVKFKTFLVHKRIIQQKDLDQAIRNILLQYKNIRPCTHLHMKDYDSALRPHFLSEVGTNVTHYNSTNVGRICEKGTSMTEPGKIQHNTCNMYSLDGTNLSENCTKFEIDLKKAYRWKKPKWSEGPHVPQSTLKERKNENKISELEKEVKILKDENQKLTTKLQMAQKRINELELERNDPLISEVIKVVNEQRLEGVAKDFYIEEMKLRRLDKYQQVKWLSYPTVFAYFQEIREFAGPKAYSCILGEVRWTGEGYKGILVGPGEKSIQNVVRKFQYLPGLCDFPLISLCRSLKKLNLIKGCCTIAGDDLIQEMGLCRRLQDGIPVWMGRTQLDSYDNLKTILKKLETLFDIRKTPNLDSESAKNARKLHRYVSLFKRKEKEGGLAKKICQLYLNVSGVFENETGERINKCFKFPIFWFVHRSMKKEDIAAMMCSSVIYIQDYINRTNLKDKLIIDSFCWDGDKAVQAFVADFSASSSSMEQEKPVIEIQIPLIKNKIYFADDIGHLLKNFRNDFYNFEKKPKVGQDIKFPVKINGNYVLYTCPLFKILNKLVHYEKDEDIHISRLRKDHVKLSDRSKMNQRLSNEIWTRRTNLGIEHSVLNRLLFGPNFRSKYDELTSSGKKFENDEESEGEDDRPLAFERKLHEAELSDTVKKAPKKKLVEWEKQMGVSIGEVLASMCAISFLKKLKFILKSKYPIKSMTDWRIDEARNCLVFLDHYLKLVKSEYPTDWKKHLLIHENFIKLQNCLHSIIFITESRLNNGVESCPSDSQSQDIIESHFALARLVAGLNNSPTVVDYFYRLAHIFVRLQYQIKKSTYEFVKTMNENDVIRKTLLSKKLTSALDKERKRTKEVVLAKIFETKSELEKQLKYVELPVYYDPTETMKFRHELGNSIKTAKVKFTKGPKYSLVSLLLKEKKEGVGQNIHIPRNWVVRVFSKFHYNIIQNLSHQNVKLWPEILERVLFEFLGSKCLNEFSNLVEEKSKNKVQLSVVKDVFLFILGKLTKYEVYEKFDGTELTPGRFKKSFRGKQSDKEK